MDNSRFFIVGAPKCGTTALCEYLKQHPQIFMSKLKESHHFADDLLKKDDSFLSRDRYLKLFGEAEAGQLIGEASVFYLYSRTAAANIQSFCEDARIIIMLRDPVEVMYALHSQLVYNGEEPILDFREALRAESARKARRLVPPRSRIEKRHLYSEVVQFSGQVQRYMDIFGRDRVHVIMYEDFKSETPVVYRNVLSFLGVFDDCSVEFYVVNANRNPRNAYLGRLLTWRRHPLLWKGILPSGLCHAIFSAIGQLGSETKPRPPLDDRLRYQLGANVRQDVERLGLLLNRNLAHWTGEASSQSYKPISD